MVSCNSHAELWDDLTLLVTPYCVCALSYCLFYIYNIILPQTHEITGEGHVHGLPQLYSVLLFIIRKMQKKTGYVISEGTFREDQDGIVGRVCNVLFQPEIESAKRRTLLTRPHTYFIMQTIHVFVY